MLEHACEFTNELLNDSLLYHFIYGLRSEQIKQKLLSVNYTFQEVVGAAIAHEAAQKDVRDLGSNSLSENSSTSVDKVKRDHFLSRGRTPARGQRRGNNSNQSQQRGNKRNDVFAVV